MNIAPTQQINFKGLWQVKRNSTNVTGVTTVNDVTYVYHPFKNEESFEKFQQAKKLTPAYFEYIDDASLWRSVYMSKLTIGNKLSVTENEFNENSEAILDSLDGSYVNEISEVSPDKLFVKDELESEEILRELEELHNSANDE